MTHSFVTEQAFRRSGWRRAFAKKNLHVHTTNVNAQSEGAAGTREAAGLIASKCDEMTTQCSNVSRFARLCGDRQSTSTIDVCIIANEFELARLQVVTSASV